MREGKPPPARPFSIASTKLPQLRWGIMVLIAAVAVGFILAAIIIMAGIIDKQGSPLNGAVPLKSFGAVITLLLLTILVQRNGKDGK